MNPEHIEPLTPEQIAALPENPPQWPGEPFVDAPAPTRERRLAAVCVTEEAFYHILCGLKGGKLLVPVWPGLPEDAEIRGGGYDFERAAFVLRLEHPRFEIVPAGCPIPLLPCTVTEFRTVAEAVEPEEATPHVVG